MTCTGVTRRVADRLAQHDGPVNCWDLMRAVDCRRTTVQTVTLRVYIHRLREQLGADAIETVRGRGYMLTERGRQLLAA